MAGETQSEQIISYFVEMETGDYYWRGIHKSTENIWGFSLDPIGNQYKAHKTHGRSRFGFTSLPDIRQYVSGNCFPCYCNPVLMFRNTSCQLQHNPDILLTCCGVWWPREVSAVISSSPATHPSHIAQLRSVIQKCPYLRIEVLAMSSERWNQ
jgi:hypothetical protein